MTKGKAFSAVLTRHTNGDVSVFIRPYNPCKTVKLDESIYCRLGKIAKKKGCSKHALMREAIVKMIDDEIT